MESFRKIDNLHILEVSLPEGGIENLSLEAQDWIRDEPGPDSWGNYVIAARLLGSDSDYTESLGQDLDFSDMSVLVVVDDTMWIFDLQKDGFVVGARYDMLPAEGEESIVADNGSTLTIRRVAGKLWINQD